MLMSSEPKIKRKKLHNTIRKKNDEPIDISYIFLNKLYKYIQI